MMQQPKINRPLVPKQCDLSSFPSMFVDVRRLLNSDMWTLGSDKERCAALNLILESWCQVPAGSLPDNDKQLAKLAGGMSVNAFQKIKVFALRNWINGEDGRLYHPYVCEKALIAWIEKLSAALAGTRGNAKRWQKFIDTSEMEAQVKDAFFHLKMLNANDKDMKELEKKLKSIIGKTSGGDSHPDSHPDSGCDRNDMIGDDINKKIKNKKNDDDDQEVTEGSRKTTFVGLYLQDLPVSWSTKAMELYPHLASQQLQAKWMQFRAYYVDKFEICRDVYEWQESFLNWIKNPFESVEDQPAAPKATKKVKPLQDGLEKLLFGQLHAIDPSITEYDVAYQASVQNQDVVAYISQQLKRLKAAKEQQSEPVNTVAPISSTEPETVGRSEVFEQNNSSGG